MRLPHSFQRKHYLLPLEQVRNPEFDCISLETMLKQLNNSGKNLLNIVILDACRADKGNDTWKMKGSNEEACLTPAFGKGLSTHVRLPVESQFALIYSSDPSTVSFDGRCEGENGVFTSALLNHLATPNLLLEDIMRNVTREILDKTMSKQRPWLNSCLTEPFYFKERL
jgi:uncharacterized caspase-like protein